MKFTVTVQNNKLQWLNIQHTDRHLYYAIYQIVNVTLPMSHTDRHTFQMLPSCL